MLMIALLTALVPVGSAHHSTNSARYVGGTYDPNATTILGTPVAPAAICQNPPGFSPAGIGGVCSLELPSAATATIEVRDDFWGLQTAFYYSMRDNNGASCGGAGRTVGFPGTMTVPIPPGCTHVSVYPDDLNTAGTVTVS